MSRRVLLKVTFLENKSGSCMLVDQGEAQTMVLSHSCTLDLPREALRKWIPMPSDSSPDQLNQNNFG